MAARKTNVKAHAKSKTRKMPNRAGRAPGKPVERLTVTLGMSQELQKLRAEMDNAAAKVEALDARDKDRCAVIEQVKQRAEVAEQALKIVEDRRRALESLVSHFASDVREAAEALKKDAKRGAIASHCAALHLELLAVNTWRREQEIASMRIVEGHADATTCEHVTAAKR
jgi:gas vesicle protein